MFLKNLFAANDLDDIKIDKIEVLENTNTIILYALSQEIIDLNHIENIKEEIRKHYNNIVNIEIQLNYKLSKNINVEKIKENIFYIINKLSLIHI